MRRGVVGLVAGCLCITSATVFADMAESSSTRTSPFEYGFQCATVDPVHTSSCRFVSTHSGLLAISSFSGGATFGPLPATGSNVSAVGETFGAPGPGTLTVTAEVQSLGVYDVSGWICVHLYLGPIDPHPRSCSSPRTQQSLEIVSASDQIRAEVHLYPNSVDVEANVGPFESSSTIWYGQAVVRAISSSFVGA